MISALAIVAGLLMLAGVVALAVPWRVRGSLQGLFDDSVWALAGGCRVGPLAISAARSAGGETDVAVHVLGRKIGRLGRASKGPPGGKLRAITGDGLDIALFAIDALARVRVRRLDLEIAFGADDPALTAAIAGGLSMLGGALGPFARIDASPDWEADREHAHGSADVEISAVPALLAWDFVRARMQRRRVTGNERGKTSWPTASPTS